MANGRKQTELHPTAPLVELRGVGGHTLYGERQPEPHQSQAGPGSQQGGRELFLVELCSPSLDGEADTQPARPQVRPRDTSVLASRHTVGAQSTLPPLPPQRLLSMHYVGTGVTTLNRTARACAHAKLILPRPTGLRGRPPPLLPTRLCPSSQLLRKTQPYQPRAGLNHPIICCPRGLGPPRR